MNPLTIVDNHQFLLGEHFSAKTLPMQTDVDGCLSANLPMLAIGHEYMSEDELLKSVFKTYIHCHKNGWSIKADIQHDYYCWIEYFEAYHFQYGEIWGSYNKGLFAESLEGLQHFVKEFPPEIWDKGDI